MDLPKDYFKPSNLVQQSLKQLVEKNHSDPTVFSLYVVNVKIINHKKWLNALRTVFFLLRLTFQRDPNIVTHLVAKYRICLVKQENY
jgi:hypothetical protein